MYMEPEDIWTTYVGAISPLEFMYKHGTQEPATGVANFLKNYPKFYGIVRRTNWHDTFCSPTQYTREEVECALTMHIDNSRAEWESQLTQIFHDEAQNQTQNQDSADESATLVENNWSVDEPMNDVETRDNPALEHEYHEEQSE